jgi:hypothetical protein
MIYRSNLTCPDLTPHFKHLHSRVMPHSMGHDVPSDWADKADDDPVFGIYKKCGFWTHDEVAILYNIARTGGIPGRYGARLGSWLDIGAHTGWTSAHISAATLTGVLGVDPILTYKVFDIENKYFEHSEFLQRFNDNTYAVAGCLGIGESSSEYFAHNEESFAGIVIDGDHDLGKPLADARNAAKYLQPSGVILFHDGIGAPVREAVTWLLSQGFKARIYWTPHIVFCCWRGEFEPPFHIGDPKIDWEPHVRAMEQDFDFGRLS